MRMMEHELCCSSVLLTVARVMRCLFFPLSVPEEMKRFIVNLRENISQTFTKFSLKTLMTFHIKEKSYAMYTANV